MTSPRPYRLFDVTLVRRTPLSPSLCRYTLGGPDVAQMRTCAPDQRIKVYFPDASGNAPALPHDNWLADYQAMDPATRPPRRTYTIRALRADIREVDIDFVLHGSTGPASRWALGAKPGDRIQIAAPDRAFEGDPGGYEWRPPRRLKHLLLLADETALPAVAGILEELASTAEAPAVAAYLEVPSPADRLPLPSWPSLQLFWFSRENMPDAAGTFLIKAAREAQLFGHAQLTAPSAELSEIDVDRNILWETQAPPKENRFYAWVAGEAAAVKTVCEILLKERGLPRGAANFMGYWRLGLVLD